MLVLTRRPGEQIVIGNGIRVTVVSVGPGRVKLGIEAPADVRIDRKEIHEKILHEQAEQAADVLATVGRAADTEDASPTMVVASETSTALHNRLADQLPATEAAAQSVTAPAEAVSNTPAPISVNRLFKNRLPRKPR